MDKKLSKSFIYSKVKNNKCQKRIMVKFMFETGLRVEEVSRIQAIDSQCLMVSGKKKMREVFHNIATTSTITKFNVSTSTIRKWVKEVLGNEYTPKDLRVAHAKHLVKCGANPKMVYLQLGLDNEEQLQKLIA